LIAQELGRARATPGEHVAPLRLVSTGHGFDVVAEGALVADLISRLVGKPLRVPAVGGPGDAKPDAALTGAFAALVVDIARSGADAGPVRLRGGRLGDGFIAEQRFTVLVEGRAYSASLRFSSSNSAAARRMATATLDSVAPDLPVRLCVVPGGGLSWTTRESLSSLRVGDVWCPGGGGGRFDAQDALLSGCALASPGGSTGIAARLEDADTLVIGDHVVALPLDIDAPTGEDAEPAAARNGTKTGIDTVKEEEGTKPGLEDTVLSAPVVVRVELGSVEMTVREWSELRAGDVVQCGKRIGEAAELRVGGSVVARGELVNVEGELGVRIVQIVNYEVADEGA